MGMVGMTGTTHIRVTEADKKRIEELADGDLSWPGKVAQVVQLAEKQVMQSGNE